MSVRNDNGVGSGGGDNDKRPAALPLLPQLYSTVDEIDAHLRALGGDGDGSDRVGIGGDAGRPTVRQLRRDDERSAPAPDTGHYAPPHLFLHFDVNETILIGDPAGGDTVEECLNKIIAKSAFVSTHTTNAGSSAEGTAGGVQDNGDDGKGRGEAPPPLKRTPSSGNVSNTSTHNLLPTHWWDGRPLDRTNGNEEEEGNPNQERPPPLYTGWTYPNQTCPYYRTAYKAHAKQFTLGAHGRAYRPLYDEVCTKLGLGEKSRPDEINASGGTKRDEEGGGEDAFANFVPAFFRALQRYFPSQQAPAPASAVQDASTTDTPSAPLPPPPKVTLVLRTFGTDLPRVARCISEFARGNHPSYPNYYNEDLILDEGDLWRAGWSHRDAHNNGGGDNGEDGERELMYELHPVTRGWDGGKGTLAAPAAHSGDDAVLDYLQSKTIVGIQDNYPFWRDRNHAPWAGKPVWARTNDAAAGASSGGDEAAGGGGGPSHKHNHHHILLDDNIHNDPDDGAGGIRVPGRGASYGSLHGKEALRMHGRHLIRVPTIRPLLEDDWFVRQIEGARWEIFSEESKETTRNDESAKPKDAHALVLSGRNLNETDFHYMRLPLNLQSVDLSRNQLQQIPDQIFLCPNLVKLDVSRNSLRGLPLAIKRLTNLATLNALSNHLRLRQLPLEELASLRHLKVLDLRFNRKLKQAALTAIEEALLPHNPQLEVRCTVLSASEGSNEEKLSACDRDATLLQSQLEPLSTPQLVKRLERSFGVVLDKDTEEAYDREYVMKTLLHCYSEHGPRTVRHEEGIPIPSHRYTALLQELEAIAWPKTTRERPKIRAEYYMILQKPGSGKPDSANSRKETVKLMKYKSIFDLAVETMKEIDADFAERFTALAVTKNFVGSPHIDTLNVGPFYGLSLGEFTGGGSIAVECSPLNVAEVDTRGRLAKVDGRFPHWVTPYKGERYSLIYYVTSGAVERQTTAIFAPPPGSKDDTADPWIPPPVYVP